MIRNLQFLSISSSFAQFSANCIQVKAGVNVNLSEILVSLKRG